VPFRHADGRNRAQQFGIRRPDRITVGGRAYRGTGNVQPLAGADQLVADRR
jgi:hypothetical protein